MISVGIDIGQFSIKIAEMDDSGSRPELIGFKEIPLSQDPNKDRKIEIVDALRRYFVEHDVQHTNFVLAVSESQTSLRRKFFPFKERHKIVKSLPFELEDETPFSQENAIFDAKITRYVGNTAEVLAAACPHEHIETQVQLAKDIGVDLHALSVDALAMSNLFSKWYLPPPQDAPENEEDIPELPEPKKIDVLLNIGHKTTSVIFYGDGVIKSVRSIDWGGEQLGQAIAKTYNMHYIEALKELSKKGFLLMANEGASKDQVAFSENLKGAIKPLLSDLKLAILEMETELHAKVTNGYVCGGVARMKNLGPYLTQSLEIAFNRFQFLADVQPEDYGAPDLGVEMVSPVAVSLAIEGLKKPRNPALNLLKGPFGRQSDGLGPFWNKWGHTLRVAGVAFVFLMVWSSYRTEQARFMADEAHTQMKQLAQSVAGLSRRSAGSERQIRKFLKEQKKAEKNRKAISKIKDMNSAMTLFERISNALPKRKGLDIDIQALLVSKTRITLQGITNTARGTAQVKKALQTVAKKGAVKTLPPTIESVPGKQSFAFQLEMSRFEGDK